MRQAVTLALTLAALLAGGAALTPSSARAQDTAAATATAPAAVVPAEQRHDADSAASAVASHESRGHAPEAAGEEHDAKDIITPHITDSRRIDYPCLHSEEGFVCEADLPRWAPLHLGGVSRGRGRARTPAMRSRWCAG
jgi:hypothetical protein